MELNLSLSPSQAKFALWIEQNTPYLLPLFDFKQRILRVNNVEHFLGAASHGQSIMARFVLGVWIGSDGFDFDFTEAAAVLDREQRQVITDWILDPFGPNQQSRK
ncbi:hypothetical protein QUS15_24970 [Escherichia coli]|uniref:Uncharacterized protein n=3 Tax=Enterobacterales TaxID=91347 RepID=A0A2I7QF83_CITFR|nr:MULTISPECIES: hypothetical protein [Gammaproteobacteria]MCU2329978.1 hypothetical protein [Enterobacter hormaechei subsp. steigerwaltii]HAS0789569.1 hypothetical protein [Enterobacter hormaechei subsp. xiangfangensis]AUR79978.1 hypothetical protein pCf587_0199 [Citrobacter freundii]MDD1412687.1 hypothetical protein [Escherichia coli]MDM8048185.1 hypothetical protein [Escherichia coli]